MFRLAYIGKGSDGRIDAEHSKQFQRVVRQPDVSQWESAPFSSADDALIAEAAAIGIVESVGTRMSLLNVQRSIRAVFPRYPDSVLLRGGSRKLISLGRSSSLFLPTLLKVIFAL